MRVEFICPACSTIAVLDVHSAGRSIPHLAALCDCTGPVEAVRFVGIWGQPCAVPMQIFVTAETDNDDA